jgi:hypothetical protein
MFCFHRTMRTQATTLRRLRRSSFVVHRLSFDDRGVAALEGLLVFAVLAGVMLGCMLLGQWGSHLQSAQMGARLLAFDAGDDSLARFGSAGDQTAQTFSSGSWDSLAGTLPAPWLNTMFVLPDDRFSGSVAGTQTGRLPSQTASLFDFSPAAMSYHSGSSAASNPWGDPESTVRSTFFGIAYFVGHSQTTAEGLDFIPEIPPAIPIVETIYARAGVRQGS